MEPYTVIKYPLSTEKGVRLMEAENKLIFNVDDNATKRDVKKAIEIMFKCKVEKVNLIRTMRGKKRAYVSFSKDKPAIDIATDLGLI
jgi:large subunit ribosomal protein L23